MLFLLLCLFSLFLLTVPAEPAVLVLSGGGEIEGELLNPSETEPAYYNVKTADGLVLRIKSDAVVKVQNAAEDTQSEYRRQYDAEAPFSENTVEKHLYWAEWCSARRLPDQANLHWQRVLELAPEQISARNALGYVKTENGWENQRERMESRGFIKSDGRWKTRQQIETESALENQKKARLQWEKKIAGLTGKLPNESAEKELLSIDDPAAAAPLIGIIRREKNSRKRLPLFHVLIRLEEAMVIPLLLEEPSDDVRESGMDLLNRQFKTNPDWKRLVQNICSGYLRRGEHINPAAKMLADWDCYEAVPELIGALITVEKIVRKVESPTTMGNGGMNFSPGVQTISEMKKTENTAVLSALQKLTGQNFQFDQTAWQNWNRRKQVILPFNLRRI
jgi:hypothetical protein